MDRKHSAGHIQVGRIGFLGAGQMARALAQGFLRAGIASPDSVLASDMAPEAAEHWSKTTGCPAGDANDYVVAASDIVILAVKPQAIGPLLDEIAPLVSPRHLIISVAAGITLSRLIDALGEDKRIVRVMPNTPSLVGAAATALARGGAATHDDVAIALELFRGVGVAYAVSESQLDAVTGLSGSGPAYVFQFIEALADGGVKAGLPRDVAQTLAAQTVMGAAKMVLETGKHPAELKDQVTSPAGTTIAGLAVLERNGVRGAIIDCVCAAADRARELGRG